MGCVLGKRVTGDGSRRKSSKKKNSDKKKTEIKVEKQSSRKKAAGELTATEKLRPLSEFRVKTGQGWPSWLTEVAGDAIKDWTPRRANTFEKLDKIGQGTYSNVYKARDLITGKIVALKKVRFDNLEPESIKFMAREILVLKKLDHPNVIKLEGLVTSRMSSSLYLVFEYLDHDLAGLAAIQDIKFSEPQDAHEHGFKSLLDLARPALVNKVKGKTDEEMMKEFAINEDQDQSLDNSVAKLINRLGSILDATVVASEDQQGLSSGLMRDLQRSTFVNDSAFMDFHDPHFWKKIPDPGKSVHVPDFEECVDHFMMSSEFTWANVLDLSNDQMRELLEATKRLKQSIDGDGRPFLDIGLNVNVSRRLIEILGTQTFQMEKIQCVAASILSRALIQSKTKLFSCKYRDAVVVVVEGIPVVVNLMLTDSIPLLAQVLDTLTLFITDYDPRMEVIEVILDSGALEAAQSIISHSTADEVLCSLARFLMVVCFICNISSNEVSRCNLNSDQEDKVLNIIKDIYNMDILPKDIYHIWPYSSSKVTTTHALAYLSYGRYVAIEEAVLERLVEFISRPSFTDAGLSNGDTLLPDAAVIVVGNIVRWGSPDQIKYLINDRKLLQRLGSSLPCCKSKTFRVEACRMISNIAARSDTLIKDLDEAGLKEALCTLVDANDCDIKLEAAWAIYNCVYGYKLKRLTTVFKDGSSDY